MVLQTTHSPFLSSDIFSSCSDSTNLIVNKRKRKPAGTPDPDAEVVSLSPRTLLESIRYVCEVCNRGFRRDQNLQMHRRMHKLPWNKLLEGRKPAPAAAPATAAARIKKVFVCPEPSCRHHHPCHALGDLVGIKKHFRRKHSCRKEWICGKCSKGYAVQSDYKAHLKTCGTRGHSCDCGRVFSRVESFIEHHDACSISHLKPYTPVLQTTSHTGSTWIPSSDTYTNSRSLLNYFSLHNSHTVEDSFPSFPAIIASTPLSRSNHHRKYQENNHHHHHNLDLQFSMGSWENNANPSDEKVSLPDIVMNEMAENQKAAYAEKARKESRREVEVAERELARTRRMRVQVQTELERSMAMKESAKAQIDSAILMLTCQACRPHGPSKPRYLSHPSMLQKEMYQAHEGVLFNYIRSI
ncbi:hypothetical protein SAY87_003615 [Trapa incisa]|uniref:C2H2-type domain-containing protein n=1 Tax=Trapa incisa TaxID=236973 RepID=A0AAN7KJE3_9MYRT|nr:hypothetical protein SAY87_003615 [Trapa incisa]